MKCKILHESAGRMRVHLNCRRMTLHQADVLEYYLRSVDGVSEVSVFDRTQDAVIVYRADRAALVHALAAFSFDKAETMDLVPDHTTRKLNREFEDKLSWTVIRRVISKLFFPLPVTTALAIYHSIKYIREGKTLEELTLDEFKQYSDLFEDDVYTAIDLTTCCEGRTSYEIGRAHV